jgi:hypothetical protein
MIAMRVSARGARRDAYKISSLRVEASPKIQTSQIRLQVGQASTIFGKFVRVDAITSTQVTLPFPFPGGPTGVRLYTMNW